MSALDWLLEDLQVTAAEFVAALIAAPVFVIGLWCVMAFLFAIGR